MWTEVVVNTLEACDRQMIQGSAEQQSGSYAPTKGWECNSVYDNVAGAHRPGIVQNGPGGQVPMLRFTTGGTPRKVGEMHMAFAPYRFPRASKGGCFAGQAAVGGQVRERVCQELVSG